MALSINYAPLEQAQSRLDVLGKNIANVGTSGYKKFSFSDDLKSAGAVQDFTQGTITSTNKPLDLAITGDSLFRVEKAGVTTYSRL
jgi:flagellar hook protein FlgE